MYNTTMLSYATLECTSFHPPSNDCRLAMLTYIIPADEEFVLKKEEGITPECCSEIRKMGWDCYILWTQSETTKYDSEFLENEAFIFFGGSLWKECVGYNL